MKPDKVDWLIELGVAGVVKIIMEEQSIPMDSAMKEFVTSQVFAGLNDRETGLYLESSSYLYELYRLALKHKS